MLKSCRSRGQGLVEFALILPALLMIVLAIIEGGLLFQSYLAIQHAAREATRFAVTMQPPMKYDITQIDDLMEGRDPDPMYPSDTEAVWQGRRVQWIKQRAYDQAMGIRILQPALEETNLLGLMDRPGFFGVRVWGFPSYEEPEQLDHPGVDGMPVRVRIYYRWTPLDPLIGAIVPNGVMMTAEATMINEGVQVGYGLAVPPTFAPPPPLEEPTEAPTPVPTSVDETPVVIPDTPTPPPTPIPPNPPYIVLIDEGGYERDPWMVEDLQYGRVQLRPSTFENPGVDYEVDWGSETCTSALHLDITLTTDDRTSDPLDTRDFMCGAAPAEEPYRAWLRTCCDSEGGDIEAPINVLVYAERPDLIVNIVVPTETIPMAVPALINVEITNVGDQAVTDTLDVDIYLDPDRTPVLPGQPGFLPVGGEPAKQWVSDPISPGASIVLSYFVTLPDSGEHLLWAQVDTSATVEESREQNNTDGPVAVMASCSDRCDDFETSSFAGRWTLSTIGSVMTTTVDASITAGEMHIAGKAPLQGARGGATLLAHQGMYTDTDSFDMRVKVTDYPDNDLSLAGLMVRESEAPGARFAAVGVVNVDGQYFFQGVAREAEDALVASPCLQRTPVAGAEAWVRITRAGDLLTLYTSGNGKTWSTADCMQVLLTDFVSGTALLPGIALVPLPDTDSTTTGWYSPSGNQADDTSGGDKNEKGFERQPQNAYADGGGYAESRDNGAAGGDAEHTDRHAYFGYGLPNLGPETLIRGIEVRLDWWVDAAPAGEPLWLGAELSWDGGANWSPIKIDDVPRLGAEKELVLGGPADTWGHTWVAEELANANFRVRLSAYSANIARDFYLDWVPVRVTYLEEGPTSDEKNAASYDYFELCRLDRDLPPTRPKPPGLRECANVVVNGTFPENNLLPWVDGFEPPAVVPRGGYSCDSAGRMNYGYSMLMRCDRMQSGYYLPFHPWAYQDFTVPTFVTNTQPVSIQMVASLFHLEPVDSYVGPVTPISPTYPGTFGSITDTLQVSLTIPGPSTVLTTTPWETETGLITPWEVATGGSKLPDREHWLPHTQDLQDLFLGDDSISNYAGQKLRLWVAAPNPTDQGDTLFYVDQVRLDICTTVQPTGTVTGKVHELSGDVRVVIGGFREPMPGVDVWAVEIPSEWDTDDELGYSTTYSIQDSTYMFQNLSPGLYRLYAQVWVSGQLYWTVSSPMVLVEDESYNNVDLVLRQ